MGIVVFSVPFDTSKNYAIFFSDQIKTSGCSMAVKFKPQKTSELIFSRGTSQYHRATLVY